MRRRQKPVYVAHRPRVTVVIPCYNYGHYLPQAVDSALEQPGVEVDVIIVDDCSTDGSQEVATRLAVQNERVSIIFHDVNRGHIRTYNHGLSKATGKYVVLLSADDLLAPGSLNRSTSLMEANPGVGLVYGYAPGFESTLPAPSQRRETWSTWSGTNWIELMCRRGHNIIVNPEAILRRSVMGTLVGYREDMPQAADMELWIRAAAIVDVGRVNGPDQGYYRIHPDNMHRTELSGAAREVKARRDVFRSIQHLGTLPLELRIRLVDQAMKKIASEAIRATKSVVGGDASSGAAATVELMEIATECDPSIRSSLSWKLLQLRRSESLPRLIAKMENVADQMLWSLRWRRWRRSGI